MIHTKINNHILKTKVVSTKKDIANGMMGSKFTDKFNSMLFVMDPLVKDRSHAFWLKNCIIPLDIIFIKAGKITKIHHNCLPLSNKSNSLSLSLSNALSLSLSNALISNKKEKEKELYYHGVGDLVMEVDGGTCKKYNFKKGDDVDLLL
jgi:uncharacterized membrane protein (UPF0127 family)